MKKIILLLALGFFTFSATSLMAQTPKPTSVETGEVATTTTSTNTPIRGCDIKQNKGTKGKPAKGQAGKTKEHGKCASKCSTKTTGHQCSTKMNGQGHGKAVHDKGKACCQKGQGKNLKTAHANKKGKNTCNQTKKPIQKQTNLRTHNPNRVQH